MINWQADDLEGAKDIAKATPGPAASVLYEGLRNANGGAEGCRESNCFLWICSNVTA
jgi:biopolymer transport protein ExbB